MSASLFVRCVRVSVLALLATTAAGWGLSRNPANEDLQDIQILPQSSSGTPAVLRDHYWYNAKTGEPAMTAAGGTAAYVRMRYVTLRYHQVGPSTSCAYYRYCTVL